MIYADHAATTPLSPTAFDAMRPWLTENYGNPSTLYSLAREPRKAISSAREAIAAAIGAEPEEIFFTSGGTEADNWALKGTAFRFTSGKRIVTDAIEHHAVLHTCAALDRIGYHTDILPVDSNGVVDAGAMREVLTDGTILVSVMLANNEIGTIEPIGELAGAAHARGILFHTDAVQAVGHIPVDVNDLKVDMLSASAHKFNGPKGVGFLYVRKGTELLPLLDGGGQERGMRSGTENVAGIVGMAVALRDHVSALESEAEYLSALSRALLTGLREIGLDFMVNGGDRRIPGSLSLSFKGADGEMLLHRLDLMGTAVATGSACNSKQTELSHVIKTLALPPDYAHGTIRVTFGMDNTLDDAQTIARQIGRILSASID